MSESRFGRFVLERELGIGGMATVHLAVDSGTGRRVALKLMHPHLAKDASFVQRFLQEIRATAGIKHPNVVEVVACGEDEGRYFIATEVVEGGTVAQLLARIGRLPVEAAAALAAQLLAGLGHAHEAGIVHRDVKPANLLLAPDGTLKIGDFGIAKIKGAAALTQTGGLLGTPAYMSPEQAGGKPLDARSDLFSAGLVFLELVTGTNPYVGENESTTMLRILTAQPPTPFELDPTLPAPVELVLDGLLERSQDRRYPSAARALADLRPYLDAEAAKHPGLLAELLLEPERLRRDLDAARAAEFARSAGELLGREPDSARRAALDLFRAHQLDPANAEVERQLRELCAAHSLSFGRPRNIKIPEYEAKLEKEPGSPGLLTQLASLYKLEGNVHRAAGCYKRLLRLKPNDVYTASQLAQLTGERTLSGATLAPAPVNAPRAPAPPPPTSLQPARPSPTPAGASRSPRQPGPTGPLAFVGLGVVLCLAAVFLFKGRHRDQPQEPSPTASSEQPTSLPELPSIERSAPEVPVVAAAESTNPPSGDPAQELAAAVALVDGGQLAAAESGLKRLMARHPGTPAATRAAVLRGRILVDGGFGAMAVTLLEPAVEQLGDKAESIEARVLLADALGLAGRGTEAVEAASEVLMKFPASEYVARARLARARGYLAAKMEHEARSDLVAVRAGLAAGDPLTAQLDALERNLGEARADPETGEEPDRRPAKRPRPGSGPQLPSFPGFHPPW